MKVDSHRHKITENNKIDDHRLFLVKISEIDKKAHKELGAFYCFFFIDMVYCQQTIGDKVYCPLFCDIFEKTVNPRKTGTDDYEPFFCNFYE